MHRADAALLEAKRLGRDRVVIAEHIMDDLADQNIVARVESAPRLSHAEH